MNNLDFKKVPSHKWTALAVSIDEEVKETVTTVVVTKPISMTLNSMVRFGSNDENWRRRIYYQGMSLDVTGCRAKRGGGLLFQLVANGKTRFIHHTLAALSDNRKDESILYAEASVPEMRELIGVDEFEEMYEQITGTDLLNSLEMLGLPAQPPAPVPVAAGQALQDAEHFGTW